MWWPTQQEVSIWGTWVGGMRSVQQQPGTLKPSRLFLEERRANNTGIEMTVQQLAVWQTNNTQGPIWFQCAVALLIVPLGSMPRAHPTDSPVGVNYTLNVIIQWLPHTYPNRLLLWWQSSAHITGSQFNPVYGLACSQTGSSVMSNVPSDSRTDGCTWHPPHMQPDGFTFILHCTAITWTSNDFKKNHGLTPNCRWKWGLLVELLHNGEPIGQEINAKKRVEDGKGKGTIQKRNVFRYMYVLITRGWGKSREGKHILRSKMGKTESNIQGY